MQHTDKRHDQNLRHNNVILRRQRCVEFSTLVLVPCAMLKSSPEKGSRIIIQNCNILISKKMQFIKNDVKETSSKFRIQWCNFNFYTQTRKPIKMHLNRSPLSCCYCNQHQLKSFFKVGLKYIWRWFYKIKLFIMAKTICGLKLSFKVSWNNVAISLHICRLWLNDWMIHFSDFVLKS